MLEYIEAVYQPWIDYLIYEIQRAAINNDAVAIRRWQRELERVEKEKAAEIDAENARHDAAIAACYSQ